MGHSFRQYFGPFPRPEGRSVPRASSSASLISHQQITLIEFTNPCLYPCCRSGDLGLGSGVDVIDEHNAGTHGCGGRDTLSRAVGGLSEGRTRSQL